MGGDTVVSSATRKLSLKRVVKITSSGDVHTLSRSANSEAMILEGPSTSACYQRVLPFTRRQKITGQWSDDCLVIFGFWVVAYYGQIDSVIGAIVGVRLLRRRNENHMGVAGRCGRFRCGVGDTEAFGGPNDPASQRPATGPNSGEFGYVDAFYELLEVSGWTRVSTLLGMPQFQPMPLDLCGILHFGEKEDLYRIQRRLSIFGFNIATIRF